MQQGRASGQGTRPSAPATSARALPKVVHWGLEANLLFTNCGYARVYSFDVLKIHNTNSTALYKLHSRSFWLASVHLIRLNFRSSLQGVCCLHPVFCLFGCCVACARCKMSAPWELHTFETFATFSKQIRNEIFTPRTLVLWKLQFLAAAIYRSMRNGTRCAMRIKGTKLSRVHLEKVMCVR